MTIHASQKYKIVEYESLTKSADFVVRIKLTGVKYHTVKQADPISSPNECELNFPRWH